MNSFTYYFDYRLLPTTFDSYFNNQVIDEQKVDICKEENTVHKPKYPKPKYMPAIMEASSVEFKRTKYNNRNVPNKKKRKHKKV